VQTLATTHSRNYERSYSDDIITGQQHYQFLTSKNISEETTLNKDQKQLWKLIRKINNCWHRGNPLELSDFFDQNVVFNSPDFKRQIIGKDNCIRTYIDFMNNSKVLIYNESNPAVQLFANTAVVTYDFEMKYEQNNNTYHETGTDILIFERRQGLWKVIWRGLSNLKNI
jgi:hypothetical protein